MDSADAYTQLIQFLDQGGARYWLIDHEPEGRTELVSPMRGNDLSQAAKCMVVMIKVGKKITRYILAVVPGNVKVDFDALKALMNGTYISFAAPEIAERLTGCGSGTILPVSFNPDLELIVDPAVLTNNEIYFNAARLDRSMVLKSEDYAALVKPRVERIATLAQ